MTNQGTSGPIVSAVIVNRNGAEHLRTCLPSLLEQSCPSIEVIVVDNASSDESIAVAQSFDGRVVALRENVGLGPGLNRGVAVAKGEFLLFVNNDMRFHENFVASLVTQLVNDQSIFAADGMQYNWEGTVKGHMATRLARGRPSGSGAAIELVPGLKFYQEDTNQISPVFMASAASMLVRRSYFENLGGFDEDIPLGYEDVDICWRAWISGWRTVYVPHAVCWHRVGSSCRSDEGSLFLFIGVLKGRLAFATRLLPVRYALFTWLASLAGLARDLLGARWRFAWTRIKVLAEFALKVPKFLAQRQVLSKKAGITPGEHLQRVLQFGRMETVEAYWGGSERKRAAF